MLWLPSRKFWKGFCSLKATSLLTTLFKRLGEKKIEKHWPVCLTLVVGKTLELFKKYIISGYLKIVKRIVQNISMDLWKWNYVYLIKLEDFQIGPRWEVAEHISPQKIGSNILAWSESWLADGKQINMSFSMWWAVIRGVPQGSVLWLQLFTILNQQFGR